MMQVVDDRVVEGDAGNPVEAALGGFQIAAVQPLQPFLDLAQRFQVVADIAVGEDPGRVGSSCLGDADRFGGQLHAGLVLLVEAGQPRQTDIGDGEIRARSKRFEDDARPVVLGPGEIGTRLQPEATSKPQSKPGRLALVAAPIQAGDPFLEVSLAASGLAGKEMGFAQLAQHPGPLTRIGNVVDDPFIERGCIRVGLVGFGSPGRLDGHGHRLVPVTCRHQVIGKVVFVRKQLAPQPIRRAGMQPLALRGDQVVVDRLPGERVAEAVSPRQLLIHQLVLHEGPKRVQHRCFRPLRHADQHPVVE